jgi:hypothetical protein
MLLLLGARIEQAPPPAVETPVKIGQEGKRFWGENLGIARLLRPPYRHTRRAARGAAGTRSGVDGGKPPGTRAAREAARPFARPGTDATPPPRRGRNLPAAWAGGRFSTRSRFCLCLRLARGSRLRPCFALGGGRLGRRFFSALAGGLFCLPHQLCQSFFSPP